MLFGVLGEAFIPGTALRFSQMDTSCGLGVSPL